jgi:predicted Zn-dependent protease
MKRSTIVGLAALLALASGAHAQTDATSTAARVLLDQANYWRAQNQPDQAASAVQRLLQLEPQNPGGLALRAELAAERGDRAAAQAALAALRQVQPDNPRIPAIELAIRAGSIDPAGLAQARTLAQQGRNAEAIVQYQRLFHGADPPAGLAVEYYETLAGTDGGWDQARTGLARFVTANPQDLRAQLAFAQLLSYREATRVEAINRLATLAQNPGASSAALKAWRQALEWLPVDTGSIPSYQAYLTKHPDDATIKGRLEEAQNPPRTPADLTAIKRSDGFAALNAGNLTEAERDFTSVLAQNPQDADALGGLGLVRLRQNNANEARTLLSRAIAADPAHRARWEQALQGASVGEDYAQARALIARGDLNGAESLLRTIITRGGDVAGAQAMLADVQVRRGNLTGAEASYRAVLSRQPNNADALVGLAQVLNRQGRSQEAEALLTQAQVSGNSALVGRIRADALRQQAAAVSDPLEKMALLRAASAAAPNDPWIRLDLARALLAAGRKEDAQQVMAEVTDVPRPSVDALRAGALFAAEDNRPQDAAALIAKLPPAARTGDMRILLAQMQLQTEIRSAIGLSAISPAAARDKLLTLAAQPDPDGYRGVAVAKAFLQMGNRPGAREALATAQAATKPATSAQRIAYAGLLLQAGDDNGAQILIRSLDGVTGLTAEQTVALNRLRAGAAVRQADILNSEGRQAEAYDVLAPELARNPNNPDLQMAVARLYARADQPRKAMAINRELLARDPGNLDARRGALDSAIQARDWALADRLVRDGMQLYPNDPRVWMMVATLDRARSDNAGALAALKRAQDLRWQEIGADVPPPAFRSGDVNPVAIYQATSQTSQILPAGGNPFRRGAAPPDATPTGWGTAPVAPSDAMSTDIAQQIASVQQDLAPKLTLGPSLRARTGSSGLDKLTELSAPTNLLVSPFGRGQLTLMATPTFLESGQVSADAGSQARFGTGAFGHTPPPSNQQASGVGLSLGYRLGWFAADVGASPLGFQEQNVLGGIELAPEIAPNLRLRILGERRAVTDSVLSYAGTKDPATGIAWGGVTRTRGHAQLELSLGEANLYAGGGYATLNGQNVEQNSEYEGGAGGSYPIWRDGNDELRLGLDLVYFGYNKNLDFFTVGQGGYFSPQSYFAGLIPLRYTGKTDVLSWTVGGSLGYQVYNQQSSPVFPNNPALQSALETAAITNSTIIPIHPGSSSSGVVGGANGSIEYTVDPTFRLGGQASFQHAGNWSEATATVFARYIFVGGL